MKDLKLTRIIVVDLRGSLPNDNRFITAVKVLQNTVTLAQTLVGCTGWCNIGLVVIKEDSKEPISLIPLTKFPTNISHAFYQLYQIIGCGGIHENVEVPTAANLVATAFQRGLKQFQKLRGETVELAMCVLTLKRTDVEKEILEFTYQDQLKIQVVEIAGSENTVTSMSDSLRIYSLPVKGFEINFESLTKEWLKQKHARNILIVLPSVARNIEIEATFERSISDPANFLGTFSGPPIPEKLTITSLVPAASLSQSYFHGFAQTLHPNISTHRNVYQYESFAEQLKENQLVALAGGNGICNDNIPITIFSDENYKLSACPVASEELHYTPSLKNAPNFSHSTIIDSALHLIDWIQEPKLSNFSEITPLVMHHIEGLSN